ncbi:MAG: phosphonate ABC transporter, permease protein PhnE [Verrucomicrobiae bacterium]|nr:phosphonate ABC transporter, permease protein PhnE [Verrucomicrobiae bacterium]
MADVVTQPIPASRVASPPPSTPPMDSRRHRYAWYVGLGLLIGALYVWAWRGMEFSWSGLARSVPHAVDFVQRMVPPDWSVSGTALTALAETIQMALLGTTFGALLSLPLAVMAARNLSPRWLTWLARGALNVIRTVPSVVWGLFFVAAIGLGPFAGVLALSMYTVGYLGKFYFETFEAMDNAAAEALRTAGASKPQIFQYAIFPQALPLLVNYTIFILEYSIRAATILGVVGAGGVGYYFQVYLRNFDYQKAATLLVYLLVVVMLMDGLSGWIRRRLVPGR